LLTVCRYVERNPLTAGLVSRAQDWRYGSLSVRENGPEAMQSILTPWPVSRRSDWIDHVNAALRQKEIDVMKVSLTRGRPFGSDSWIQRIASKLNLEHTLRREGRPSKAAAKSA
jgi:putative transposase